MDRSCSKGPGKIRISFTVSPLIFLHPVGLVTFADGIPKRAKYRHGFFHTGLMGSRSMGIPEFNKVCTGRE